MSGFRKILYNKKVAPYIFVFPFLICFFVFFLYPTISAFIMSFEKIQGFGNVKFIGLGNYKRLLNVHFLNTLRTNTIYTLCVIITLVFVPIVFAVIMNSAILPGKKFFRSVIFVPALISAIVAGVAFRLIFSELNTGFINMLIIALGGKSIAWDMGYGTGMLMLVSLTTWRVTGINVVYYLSALQSVPEELYESADIDGANVTQKFFRITLPQIKPIMIYVLTITVLEGYRMFTESYILWTDATPGDIGLTIVRYIYTEAFQNADFGYGCAIGIVLLGIVLIINLIQLNFFGLFKKED